jgi:ABC-type phosphate transport system substrate-binding protein
MRHVAGLLCTLAVLLTTAATRAEERGLVVIVHPSRTVRLSVDDVARIFLKKQRFWDDGSPIVALNREAQSPLRETFTRRVFGLSSDALATYWNRQYFLGVLPPATLSSSEAVKRYVASEPGAIGYIEASLADDSVRVASKLEGAGD